MMFNNCINFIVKLYRMIFLFPLQGVGPGRCRGICGTPLDSGLSQGVGYLSCFIYDDIVSFDDVLLII
jgi:hypothetical protein